jgi:hypothetical protein
MMTIGVNIRNLIAAAAVCGLMSGCVDDDDNTGGFIDEAVSNPPPSAPAPTPSPTPDPPAEDPPAEDPPAEDPPADDPPAEDPPAENPPADGPPADDPPADDPPADDPPADDPPADDPPADDPPADDPPADDPPADDPPADDPPPTNSAPTISGAPRDTVMAGERFEFTPTASDPDDDPLTFTIENQPGWIDSFDAQTGRLSGTPGEGDIGSYSNIVITVSDGSLSDSLSPFSISVVQAATGSVELSWTAPTLNTDGTPLTDLTGYAFYYGTASGSYPNRIEVNDASLTTYVVDNLTPGTYYFVAVAITSGSTESEYSSEAVKEVTP